jgi:hypothetical protein
MPNLAPSDYIDFHHVRRPSAGTAATRNQSTRIDVGVYDYILVLICNGALGGTTTLTPVVYAAATGGTGTRCDGTLGNPDLTISYLSTEDNLGSCIEMRTKGLPGQWLGFEEAIVGGAGNTYSIVVLGFRDAAQSLVADRYDAPLASTDSAATRKVAHYGFA